MFRLFDNDNGDLYDNFIVSWYSNVMEELRN